jgi:threonyl-tRNA synthetase
MNITDAQAAYAQNVADALNKIGFRVQSDLRNEKISYKIREHSLQKLPYQLIVGEKERAASTVAMRNRKGEDLGSMPLAAIVERFQAEVQSRSRTA